LKFEHNDALHPESQWRDYLDIALPQQGVGIEKVADELVNQIIPNGSAFSKPGYTAFITTGPTSAATLAATAANIAAPQRYTLNAFNFLEELSLQWLATMCRISHMQGIYSSGGSVANLLALGAARQFAFEKIGRDVAANGIDRSVCIYASKEAHHTIQRAAGVLGIGRRLVREIPCDNQGRMSVDELQRAVKADKRTGVMPIAIVANAGTTNTGAIDPLQKIGEIAKEHDLWFHVDGAYGLPGILDERIGHLYQGLTWRTRS